MSLMATLPATTTRVERHTNPEINDRIRRRTDARLGRLEGRQTTDIEARLRELEREWDIERVLQTNASTLVILGTALGYAVDRRFLFLPFAVLSFFAQHALQGWCPPLPLLRRRGVRTTREIERERYALKALRGDFDDIPSTVTTGRDMRVRAALDAIDR